MGVIVGVLVTIVILVIIVLVVLGVVLFVVYYRKCRGTTTGSFDINVRQKTSYQCSIMLKCFFVCQ